MERATLMKNSDFMFLLVSEDNDPRRWLVKSTAEKLIPNTAGTVCPALLFGGEEVILSSVCVCWGIWRGAGAKSITKPEPVQVVFNPLTIIRSTDVAKDHMFFILLALDEQAYCKRLMGDLFSDAQRIQKKGPAKAVV